jgi:hypothetical protein
VPLADVTLYAHVSRQIASTSNATVLALLEALVAALAHRTEGAGAARRRDGAWRAAVAAGRPEQRSGAGAQAFDGRCAPPRHRMTAKLAHIGRAVVAIHGGAGTLSREAISGAQQASYRAALDEILRSAQALLADGAGALDVVTEAVRRLEECPLFNAGLGAVYTADAQHELDACVMRGSDLAAGAVAGVRTLRNPVLAARAVLDAGGPCC